MPSTSLWEDLSVVDIFWLIIAYSAGTFFTMFFLRHQMTESTIEKTIDGLIAQGFLRYKKVNGEIEILKWNDNQNG